MERHVDGREIVEASDRAAWRGWLAKRHEQREAIWLVFHKKTSDGTSPSYEEAVEEALCFGWIGCYAIDNGDDFTLAVRNTRGSQQIC